MKIIKNIKNIDNIARGAGRLGKTPRYLNLNTTENREIPPLTAFYYYYCMYSV